MKMEGVSVWLVLLLASIVKASHYGYGGNEYKSRYLGRCSHSGYYYHDSGSFMVCHHGVAFLQPCAPGTQNFDSQFYGSSVYENTAVFCGVNLISRGYLSYYGIHGYHNQPQGGYRQSYQTYSGPSYRPQGRSSSGYGSQQGYKTQSYGSYSYSKGYGSGGGYGQSVSIYKPIQPQPSYSKPSYKPLPPPPPPPPPRYQPPPVYNPPRSYSGPSYKPSTGVTKPPYQPVYLPSQGSIKPQSLYSRFRK